MIRTAHAAFAAFAAFAVFAAAGAAQAADPAAAPGLRVAYPAEKLATAAGREEIRANIAFAVQTWCKANPVKRTVAGCRAELEAELSKALEVQARTYAAAHRSVELARR